MLFTNEMLFGLALFKCLVRAREWVSNYHPPKTFRKVPRHLNEVQIRCVGQVQSLKLNHKEKNAPSTIAPTTPLNIPRHSPTVQAEHCSIQACFALTLLLLLLESYEENAMVCKK